jgi:DNA-binding GntR family transcriptional regulator
MHAWNVPGRPPAVKGSPEEETMQTLLKLKGPIPRTSLAESVYQHILEALLAGHLPGGSELSEVDLAAELGVSRTPVHEALRRLAADGLVDRLAHRRARVARFARHDILEIYEMRTVLETAAAERAAQHLDPAQLAELRAAADALGAGGNARGWMARALDFDVRFHEVLAAATGNERLRAEIVKYRHLVRAFCRISGNADNLRQAMREHRRILDALEARDAAAARRAMAAHIDARLQAVLRELEAEEPS